MGIVALVNNELRIVQTSMLGSILSNLLLVLGCSFAASGLKFQESTFQATAAQASSSILTLATATLIIPAAYHASKSERAYPNLVTSSTLHKEPADEALSGLLFISRGTAIILLLLYFCYLYFQLKSHAFLFEAEQDEEDEEPKMNVAAATGAYVALSDLVPSQYQHVLTPIGDLIVFDK